MQSTAFDPLKIAQRYWGMSLVRGVVAIIFGLLAIFWPHLTFAVFMLVFGIFAIVEGCILFGSAFTQHTVNTPMANFARRAANTALGTDTTTRNSAQRAEPAMREDYAQESERMARAELAHGAVRPAGDSRARRAPEPQQGATGYVTHTANR